VSKRAIVFALHPWNGPFQLGAHHYARALARAGFKVLYVSAPLSPPHAIAALVSAPVRARWGEYFSPRGEPGIIVRTPFTLLPLSARLGANKDDNLRRWPEATLPSLPRALQRLDFMQPDLALIDGPLQLAAARLAEPKKLVLRVFDRFARMPGMTPALARLAGQAAQQADLVVCSAHNLKPDAEALGARRVLVLHNGVDAARFAEPHPEPTAYANLPRARAVYVGQTGPLFDRALLERVAAARPHVSFIILGPLPAQATAQAPPNLHRLGPVQWRELPAYLQHADVGLVPFDVAGHPDYVAGVQPLKLYEYLASGLPVVSTRWDELERIGAPGVTLADAGGFGIALDRALAAAPDAAQLRAFAAGADWNARVAQLLAALD
jgi:glycosyltransferase involved in cell wall biosynthesis